MDTETIASREGWGGNGVEGWPDVEGDNGLGVEGFGGLR